MTELYWCALKLFNENTKQEKSAKGEERRIADQPHHYSLKLEDSSGLSYDPQTWFMCPICLLSLTLSIHNSTGPVNLPNKKYL